MQLPFSRVLCVNHCPVCFMVGPDSRNQDASKLILGIIFFFCLLHDWSRLQKSGCLQADSRYYIFRIFYIVGPDSRNQDDPSSISGIKSILPAYGLSSFQKSGSLQADSRYSIFYIHFMSSPTFRNQDAFRLLSDIYLLYLLHGSSRLQNLGISYKSARTGQNSSLFLPILSDIHDFLNL